MCEVVLICIYINKWKKYKLLEDWGELREKFTLSLLAFIDFKMIHIYKTQEREKTIDGDNSLLPSE